MVTILSLFAINCATVREKRAERFRQKQKQGTQLIVQKIDGQQVRGELIAVKEKSLLLLDAETGVDVSVDIEDVWTIKIAWKSEALKGGAIGFVLGIIIGYYVGYPMGSESGFILSKHEAGSIGIAIGGLIGAGLGAGIGSQVRTYRKVQIEGRPDTEVKEVLEKLRKKARIPDYK